MSIYICRVDKSHQTQFIEAAKASKKLHGKWVQPPTDSITYKSELLDEDTDEEPTFLVFTQHNHQLVGCVNINGTHRYNFCSAYIGYYAFTPMSNKGLMKIGLSKVINYCFNQLNLHRLEANIQPENKASIGLVKSLGFTKEGYSERYLKIRGRWRDHERWAIIKDNWRLK